ncbi:TRAP transporter small permease subunit, partial [Chloroflexota bacterium]
MRAALKVIDIISEWSGKVSSLLIYAGIFLLVYEVFLRYVFDSPTRWVYGTTQRLFAFFHIIGGAYVLLYRAHISMD